MTDARAELLDALAADLVRRARPHPLRVAIDGPDAAGKTTLADDLAPLVGRSRPVIRLSVDQFHHPAAIRHRRGPLSPEGYYRDSFDLAAVVDGVLAPLGPGGDGWYRPGTFDHRTDTATAATRAHAPPDAVLLFDGVFLLRPELRPFWDVALYLHVDPGTTLARGRARDGPGLDERYRRRYLPGQALYRAEAAPARHADLVLDLSDPARPHVLTGGRPSPRS